MSNQQAKKPEDKMTVATLLRTQQKEIARALPRHMSPDRMTRIALTEMRKNPALVQCDPFSFLGAVIQCAQLGLEPGSGLGHAYLIPFRNKKLNITEVVFMPGYRGLIDLARRSGQVETISARLVREKDRFVYEYGDGERIEHTPFDGAEDDAGKITHVYAIARMKGGGIQREVMNRAQIDAIRTRGNNNPVWESDFDEMARKTVVRRICKYLPMSPELAGAVEADNTTYRGEPQRNWEVLDVSYEPKPAPHDPEKTKAMINEPEAPPAYDALDNKQVAINELVKAATGVRKIGGDPEKILGRKIDNIMLEQDSNKIMAAADVLSDWKP
jgi:recombination protein RecT